MSTGNMLQGIYKDICPPSSSNVRICGHDANGKQIPCGSSCPTTAQCYDPTVASLQGGVFGNLLLSSSITTSVSSDLKMENISLIFGEFAAIIIFGFIQMSGLVIIFKNHAMNTR